MMVVKDEVLPKRGREGKGRKHQPLQLEFQFLSLNRVPHLQQAVLHPRGCAVEWEGNICKRYFSPILRSFQLDVRRVLEEEF